MKRIVLLFSVILVYSAANAQISIGGLTSEEKQTIDTARVQVSYELTYVKDSLFPDKTSVDYQVLEVGTHLSKYYSDNVRRRDSIMAEMIKSQKGAQNIRITTEDMPMNTTQGDATLIYKNYPQNKITVINKIALDNYQYTDDLDAMKWSILSDTMTVLTYPCQKAVCDFRGRHYEAWFTTEIPVNSGPWKFGGLPGLILQLSDSRGHYVYKCFSIYEVKNEITIPKNKIMTTSRKDYQKLVRKFNQDPMAYLQKQLEGSNTKVNIQMRKSDGSSVTPGGQAMVIPYNPMELD